MNIVLFGEDIFTATVLERLLTDQQTILAVVCPLYKNSREHESLQKATLKNQIPFVYVQDVNGEDVRKRLMFKPPDLIIVVHLRRILNKSIYSTGLRGAINVHPSLLPKYRGLSPQHQALIHGDPLTGVTIHFIEEEPDSGDIILQEEIYLEDDISVYELLLKMLSIYGDLVSQVVKRIEINQIIRVVQNEKQASWYGPLKRADREINCAKSTREIYNLIRAVSKPYHGAFYQGVTIWRAFFPNTTEKILMEKYLHPGIYFEQGQAILRLKDGILVSEDFEKREI